MTSTICRGMDRSNVHAIYIYRTDKGLWAFAHSIGNAQLIGFAVQSASFTNRTSTVMLTSMATSLADNFMEETVAAGSQPTRKWTYASLTPFISS